MTPRPRWREHLADLAGLVASQDRAVANARRSATELSRRRVQREEAHLYVERRLDDRARGRDVGVSSEPLPGRTVDGSSG